MWIMGENLTHPIGRHGQGPVPGDGLEAARPFGTASQQGSEQSSGIHPLPPRIFHLGAQVTLGQRMIRIAADASYFPVFHFREDGTATEAVPHARVEELRHLDNQGDSPPGPPKTVVSYS